MTKADIQLIRSLDDKRARADTVLFVAEGRKLTDELLASDMRVRKLYVTGETAGTTGAGHNNMLRTEAVRGAGKAEAARVEAELGGVEIEHISPGEMERISRLKTPTDRLALVEIPRYSFDPKALGGRLTLALDEVQNPGNMGTLIRLADWFGITDILCSEGSADCFNPKVVQATMGAITRVRMHYGDLVAMIANVADGHGAAKAADASNTAAASGISGAEISPFPVYGTFLEGENIYGAPVSREGIIVLGSEGRGISPAVADHVTRKLFIPPYRTTGENAGTGTGAATSCVASTVAPESLNVAIAAAIVCSEFRRR